MHNYFSKLFRKKVLKLQTGLLKAIKQITKSYKADY